jgi:hypothetical protein
MLVLQQTHIITPIRVLSTKWTAMSGLLRETISPSSLTSLDSDAGVEGDGVGEVVAALVVQLDLMSGLELGRGSKLRAAGGRVIF